MLFFLTVMIGMRDAEGRKLILLCEKLRQMRSFTFMSHTCLHSLNCHLLYISGLTNCYSSFKILMETLNQCLP